MADIELMRFIERAPLRTVRWEDVAAHVPNAARTLARLADMGALTRIARGVYIAPPEGADGRTWKPPLEAAALALGTARYGQRRVVLAGIGAARHWGAIPRALANTTLAVAVRGRQPVTLETGGTVTFVHRNLEQLDATLEPTVLGEALVATPAQTIFDLTRRHNGVIPERDTDEAVRNLMSRITKEELADIALRAQRVPAAVTRILNQRALDG
ncbi:hypothetical protein J2X85_002536 [Microbacterium trichothecenolyticum]|uniref:type IV toxin-antitoxin system AbiEi family antitoxin n=1 Tax=Microbacterium trichothecenolyticum TaxID=69370 RepID=UPI002861DFB8|nr:type IV toxin-antitoxin system AbiEi family antitoxin [Microbacterium trichothecenolyticum]MDR7185502.1 hypothetical protein [Microbacterium trichothecenolyticum]